MVRWKSENIFGSLWNCGGMELVSWLMHLLKECGHICPRPSPNVVWVINVRDVNIRFLTGSHAYCSLFLSHQKRMRLWTWCSWNSAVYLDSNVRNKWATARLGDRLFHLFQQHLQILLEISMRADMSHYSQSLTVLCVSYCVCYCHIAFFMQTNMLSLCD